MRYYKRLGIYKNSSGSLKFNPLTKESWSYGWYKLSGYINGRLVLNVYNYSSTTTKHKYDVMSMLPDNVVRIEAPKGLDHLSDAISLYEQRIKHATQKLLRARKPDIYQYEIKAAQEKIDFIKKELL